MNPIILFLGAVCNIIWGIFVGSNIVIGIGTLLAFMGIAQTVRDYEQKPEVILYESQSDVVHISPTSAQQTRRMKPYEDKIIDAEYVEVTEEDQ